MDSLKTKFYRIMIEIRIHSTEESIPLFLIRIPASIFLGKKVGIYNCK